MNHPDPLVLLLDVLVQRHGLSPERAWAMLSRAAERKGTTVDAMVAALELRRGERVI